MTASYYRRRDCRLCGGTDIDVVFHLTPTPLCDAYITKERLGHTQEVYPLDLCMCRQCGYVHVPYVVAPESIYRDYIYVTTSSLGLRKHFAEYAEAVFQKINPPRDALLIDIGSNDGTLLQFFKDRGMRTLGIEPATVIAHKAEANGIETVADFFSLELAKKIKDQHGPADAITINNLFANIDQLDELMAGVKHLLTPEGVFIVESSYLADMIKNMVFDFIYHEHLSYLSVLPLVKFFKKHDMQLFDIERVATKGGSLRYYIKKCDGSRTVSARVNELARTEERQGLYRKHTYKAFSDRINTVKTDLCRQLREIRSKGKSIAGYGGSATTTTLVYYFGIGEMIDFIVDDNPSKIGTFSPGLHIPVYASDELYRRKPAYTLMLAWRYAEPIIAKHQSYLKSVGRFIVPLPEISLR